MRFSSFLAASQGKTPSLRSKLQWNEETSMRKIKGGCFRLLVLMFYRHWEGEVEERLHFERWVGS